jgi:flavorubredoxin
MAKAIVIYATRTNQTGQIAQLISEGMRIAGVDATVLDLKDFKKEKHDLEGYDAVILGSATYHGEMLQSMKTFLFQLENMNLKGKVGGSFGAFGWSGEAPGRVYDTMKNIYNMNMVESGPLLLKSAALGGGVQMAHGYGREIAEKIGVSS